MESLPTRLLVAKQIVESLHEIRLAMQDSRLHGVALEVLASDIRTYSGQLPDMEREILRFEISLVLDMIASA